MYDCQYIKMNKKNEDERKFELNELNLMKVMKAKGRQHKNGKE